jgi:hypothetical protein
MFVKETHKLWVTTSNFVTLYSPANFAAQDMSEQKKGVQDYKQASSIQIDKKLYQYTVCFLKLQQIEIQFGWIESKLSV